MKSKQKKLLTTLFLSILLTLAGSVSVFAAVTVKQTAQTTNSVTVSISNNFYKMENLTLTLQQYNDKYERVNVGNPITIPAGTTSYTFSNLNPGSEYYVRADYSYYYSASSSKPSTSYTSVSITSAPGKVTNVRQLKWWYYIESVNFGWDKQPACKYEWAAYAGKKRTPVASSNYESSYNEASFKIKNNKIYAVKVRAYTTINGQKLYGDWSDEAYLFTQPMVKKLTIKNNGKMSVSWEKIDGIDKYEVYASTKEHKGYKRVAKVSSRKGSVTVKKLGKKKFSRKKTYYVYVVALKKVGGGYYNSGRNYSACYKKGSVSTRHSFNDKA